jgi:hemoglobin/transferrin/lactoferrin receptor protein
MRFTHILLCILCSYFSYAQDVVIIYDNDTAKPLDLVTLTNTNGTISSITNSHGEANIRDFVKEEKIIIRRIGYETTFFSYENIKANNFKIYLNSKSIAIDELVISATKWQQSNRKVPSKITRISQKDMALIAPQTAADLLGISGEVFIQKSQQGGGSPMIRGFATNRLLYSIDGVRMNNAIFRAGNIQNVISLDALTMENTEVLFGTSSVIYGSDAIGGVMLFQTLTPQLATNDKLLVKAKALSRYSSVNEELTNHINFNIGGKKWSSVTSITLSNYGDLRMGTNGPSSYLKNFFVERINYVDQVIENPNPLVQKPTAFSQTNIMQKLRFKPNEKLDFQYGFHFSETSEYARYDRLIELQNNGLPSSAVWNYGPQKWLMHHFKVDYKQKHKFFDQLSLNLASQIFEESRIDRRFNNFRLRTQSEQVNAYSINLDFEKTINKHQLVYGTEYVLNRVKSTADAIDIRNNNPIATPSRYPMSDWASLGVYLHYNYEISDQILLQSGMRYNQFKIDADFGQHLNFYPLPYNQVNINKGSLTGSLGLVYAPEKTWKFGLNASTGFRAPNIDDIGKLFDFAANEVVVPNPNLNAEYAYNGEITVSKTFGKIAKLDVAGFYTHLDHAMVRRPFLFNNESIINYNGNPSQVFAIQNAAFGYVYGFNAGLEFNLTKGLKLLSKYNFQIGQEELDNGETARSRHAAPAFGLTALTYTGKKFTCQLSTAYSAEVSYDNLNPEERQKPFIYAKDGNGNPYSPGWYTLNLKGSAPINKYLSLNAGVENITDQRYRPYSSGLVAGGRNFMISLTGVL